ncbi:hypothetical protein IAT40_005207 [Kwoniella sp. CBS 6097]
MQDQPESATGGVTTSRPSNTFTAATTGDVFDSDAITKVVDFEPSFANTAKQPATKPTDLSQTRSSVIFYSPELRPDEEPGIDTVTFRGNDPNEPSDLSRLCTAIDQGIKVISKDSETDEVITLPRVAQVDLANSLADTYQAKVPGTSSLHVEDVDPTALDALRKVHLMRSNLGTDDSSAADSPTRSSVLLIGTRKLPSKWTSLIGRRYLEEGTRAARDFYKHTKGHTTKNWQPIAEDMLAKEPTDGGYDCAFVHVPGHVLDTPHILHKPPGVEDWNKLANPSLASRLGSELTNIRYP